MVFGSRSRHFEWSLVTTRSWACVSSFMRFVQLLSASDLPARNVLSARAWILHAWSSLLLFVLCSVVFGVHASHIKLQRLLSICFVVIQRLLNGAWGPRANTFPAPSACSTASFGLFISVFVVSFYSLFCWFWADACVPCTAIWLYSLGRHLYWESGSQLEQFSLYFDSRNEIQISTYLL